MMVEYKRTVDCVVKEGYTVVGARGKSKHFNIIFSVQGKNEIHYRSQFTIAWILSYALSSKQTHK